MHDDAFRDKNVLITGGTTGIGRAIAIDLAGAGAKVLIFGRHQKELDDALKDIPGAAGMTADAAKPEDVSAVLQHFDEEFGAMDLLVANAAIGVEGLADLSDKEWRYAIETNISGYLAFAREAATRMKAAGKGHIVLIGSISADTRDKNSSVYVATKAAIQGFAEAFAKEMAEHGVRVSLIEPGAVGSDMQGKPEPQREKIAKHEMLMAEDVAECLRFVVTRPQRVNLSAIRIIPRIEKEA